MIRFKKTVLENGLTVVSEAHPQSHAVSIGVWVLTGTRDEPESDAGVSHFLEHMVFKGTKTRSAFQIAKSLEQLGGDLNAFTTRENTCYHALVLKDHWRQGLEVLSDLVSGMDFSKADYALEKSVILQEIAMSDDNIEELIYDIYLEKALPKSPLGKPILGTVASIAAMKASKLKDYYKSRYSGNNLILAAAGNIDHQDLVDEAKKLLGKKKKVRLPSSRMKPSHRAFRHVEERQVEQLHFLSGFPSASFKDKHRFEAFIVNALLGGGMTSRLYQSVREKKGLVYSIHSSLNTFDDFGLINIYAACEPKNMRSVVKNIVREIQKARKRGITSAELKMYQTQVSGSILLGSDDIDNRMQSIAVNEMVFGKYKPVEQVIDEIRSVTPKSVKEYFEKYIDVGSMGAILMGGQAEAHRNWFFDFDFKRG
ncbi:MAG: insulinase family protein [Proteobacteria bacterium]|nr:insulinase family protein [Pseudomonadota bacterium]